MADRYWVGGTGTWNTSLTTNWSTTSGGSSGASVPTSSDSVFFDQAGTYTVTLAGSLLCLDITVSAGTVTIAQGSSPFLNVRGSMTLAAGTVWSATVIITFSSTTTGRTITTNGVSMPGQFTFNGVGGGWTLGSDLTNTAGSFLLTAGALNLGGYTCTCGIFSSTGTGVRSIAFGSTNIVLTNTLSMAIATNFTCTTSGGGFSANATGAKTHVFGTTGGTSANAPNLTFSGVGGSTISFTTGSYFNKLDFGTTVSATTTTSLNLNSLTLATNGTYTGLTVTMVGTGTIIGNNRPLSGLTINHGGVSTIYSFPNTSIAHTAGTVTLAADCSSASYFFDSGTLNLNNFTLTQNGSSSGFNAYGSLTRTINFGAGNILLACTGAGVTVVNLDMASGYSSSATTGGFTYNSTAGTQILTFASGTSANSPNLTFINAGSFTIYGTGGVAGGTFNKLDFGTVTQNGGNGTISANSIVLSPNATYTNSLFNMWGTGTINGNGKTIFDLTISHTGTTTLLSNISVGPPATTTNTTTLTAGALALGVYTLTTGLFSSNNSNVRSIAFGTGNIVLAHWFSAIVNLSMANATNFTWTGTGGFTSEMSSTRTFTFGTTGGTSANAPNLSITSGASIPTFTTGSYFGKLDFTGSTCTPAITSLNLNSLTLATGGTYTGLTVTTRGTGTVNGNGKTVAALTINNGSGITTTLAAAITASTVTLTSGTLNLAGYTLTATTTVTNGSTASRNITFNGGTIACSAATATAWNFIFPSGFTTTAGTGTGTINMTAATAKTFVGGGVTYNCTVNQGGAGALTITGSNTFSNMTNSVQPATVLFTAFTVNSFKNFNLNGTSGNLITLGSSTAATHTLATLSGIVSVNYLSISFSVATGTNTWYANQTSTDVSNNTGWVFGSPVGAQFAVF